MINAYYFSIVFQFAAVIIRQRILPELRSVSFKEAKAIVALKLRRWKLAVK